MPISTICWSCENATGKCPWSKEYKEIDGWVAKETHLKSYNIDGVVSKIKSYIVIDCPLFVGEKPKIKESLSKMVCNKYHINIRTYFRWVSLGYINKQGKILNKRLKQKLSEKGLCDE